MAIQSVCLSVCHTRALCLKWLNTVTYKQVLSSTSTIILVLLHPNTMAKYREVTLNG